MSLTVWFAWKSAPKVEHEATHGEVTSAEVADVRDRLSANPAIDHVTVYERTDAGDLIKLS